MKLYFVDFFHSRLQNIELNEQEYRWRKAQLNKLIGTYLGNARKKFKPSESQQIQPIPNLNPLI